MKASSLSFTLMAGICLISFTGLALGQGGASRWEKMKSRFDANKDGKVTKEEFTGPAQMFSMMDQNKDGVVTETEASQMRRGGTKGKGGRPGGGSDSAPQVGADAPDVGAKNATGEVVDLGNPTRTTVLVFGSHT